MNIDVVLLHQCVFPWFHNLLTLNNLNLKMVQSSRHTGITLNQIKLQGTNKQQNVTTLKIC